MSRPSRKRRAKRAILLVLLAALVTIGVLIGARVRLFRHHLRSAEIGLAQLETTLAGGMDSAGGLLQDLGQLTALRATAAGLQGNLAEMRRLAAPFVPLSRALGWLPRVGGDIKAAPYLLELAQQTSAMALGLLDALTPIANLLGQTGSNLGSTIPESTGRLLSARPQVQVARASFEKADQARKAVDPGILSPKLQGLVARFDRHAPSVVVALDALEVLPKLLGAQEPFTYLVLAQNSDELRATGGFISGVGGLELSQGQITSVSFQDSYAVDNLEKPHPPAPAPLRQYMKAGMLVLRDANWWPDFPTSARMAESLFAQDTGQPADGVIAVDVVALELLVEVLGPIEVPGYPDPISGTNLHAALRQYWQAPIVVEPGDTSDWWLHRKDFAGDLLMALLQKATDESSPEQVVAVARSLTTALSKRHIQVYAKDPDTEALLQRIGWDGSVRAHTGDFLMVVDSNVGFNKVNPNIEQSISYDVLLDESGTATSEITLTYRHLIRRPTPACVHEPRYGDSYGDLMERCYWDYLRVYLPAGIELVALSGGDSPLEIGTEGGLTVLGTGFLLETGQSRTIQITYRRTGLPQDGRYTLRLQKQPGAQTNPYRVSVRTPEGSELVGITPGPLAFVDGQAIWQGAMDKDIEIGLSWQ